LVFDVPISCSGLDLMLQDRRVEVARIAIFRFMQAYGPKLGEADPAASVREQRLAVNG
jgi:hypothetical protein